MKFIVSLFLIFFLLNGCDRAKETLGLYKYKPDEYEVATNPPLDIPPDFDVVSPEEIKKRKLGSSGKISPNSAEDFIIKNME